MDEVFRAISDPTRRRILSLLRERDMTAGEIADYFPISAASMSHHFRVLSHADLIERRRRGQQILYSLNTTVLQGLAAALMDLFDVGIPDPKPSHDPS